VDEREPTSEKEARAWVEAQVAAHDPFRSLAEATERHRAEHGCHAYASSDGPLLTVLARGMRARRVLEIGTALGYTAASLALGTPDGAVDTIEADASHAELAGENLRQAGLADRVRVHVGRSPAALDEFEPGFDLVFYDAYVPSPSELAAFRALLRPGGLLITSNLFLGQYDPALPGLGEGAAYRRRLFDHEAWTTSFAGLKALSIRL
jgi:predicted O-methyltransferase YrrM